MPRTASLPRSRALPFALALAAALPLAACDAADGEMSCTAREDGRPSKCQEFTGFSTVTKVTAQASLQILCEVLQADVGDGGCDRAGALAGCREDEGQWTRTTWYYPTDDHPTAQSVTCPSDETRVAPDGTEAPPADACSVQSQVAVSPTFENRSGQVLSAFWVDTACTQNFYWSLQPGESREQPTYVGHVWRFRAGDGDPAGALLKEYKAVFDDRAGATPTVPIP